ncbi:MAG: 16S rRNA (cytidine(1402)-2'-O)-methyltransferase [Dehalococcoidia bacterium]
MTDTGDEQPLLLESGLYVVATPIGNLGDWSPRARAVIAAATVVAAEDTRVSAKLLALAGSSARMVSLTEHNVVARTPALLAAAREGVVAVVSDAGTPGVSDPGGRLVAAAHAEGIRVAPIPGASALAAAVSVAGFDGTPVVFLGFLPRPKGERLAVLSALPPGSVAVLFESPGRAAATLGELAATFSDPEVTVCRELTKRFEEVRRGRAGELAGHFTNARGEFTVVVAVPAATAGADDREVERYLGEMRRAGARRSGAAAEAARRFGVPREHAYALWPEAGTDEPT